VWLAARQRIGLCGFPPCHSIAALLHLHCAGRELVAMVCSFTPQACRHCCNAALFCCVVCCLFPLADQYKASWQRAASPEDFVAHPNFYLHAPARTDPSAAPPGCDSIMVLLPVANIQQRSGNDSYDALVAAGRQLVLKTLQAAGISLQLGDIVHEVVRQPAEWREMYALEHGAAFGLSHGLDQLAIFRPPVKEPQLQGLYFVGASSRPGNGVPLVMMGGRIAAERILRDAAAQKQQAVVSA
jgi:phytoene desaturase (3,4-didehydrolycopene-forming)